MMENILFLITKSEVMVAVPSLYYLVSPSHMLDSDNILRQPILNKNILSFHSASCMAIWEALACNSDLAYSAFPPAIPQLGFD
jgi:hypothetical protein